MEVLFFMIALAIIGVLNILCFLIGAKVGQAVQKGEEVKLPSVNPVKVVREHLAKKEAEAEQSKVDTILRNIERYDGTEIGQEDV